MRSAIARGLPEPAIARLALYLRALNELRARKMSVVSSSDLADRCGGNPAIVRKDLSKIGSIGRAGIGYDVRSLVAELEGILDVRTRRRLLLVGAGKLGQALVNADDFLPEGVQLAAAFDIDGNKLGQQICGVTIRHINDLNSKDVGPLQQAGGAVGIIATPAWCAQQVAEQLIKYGIRSILNFAPVALSVPEHTTVRNVDLSMELQVLCHYAAAI